MKFATIAASVLVASSVLASAGVVSANDFTTTGNAKVAVTNDGGSFSIDQAPGVGTTMGTDGKAVANDLDFGTVKLTELAEGAKTKTAELNAEAFGVTNTMGVANWTLKATVDSFKDATTGENFGGNLIINNQPLTDKTGATLYSSADTAGFKNDAHTSWKSPAAEAQMTVPATAKLGNYTATITYTLSATPTTNTPSSSPATTNGNN